MHCLQCGAEMRLIAAIPDKAMMVPGYEDQTFECTSCRQIEQRRTFRSASAAAAGTAGHVQPGGVQLMDASPAETAAEPARETAPPEAALLQDTPTAAAPVEAAPLATAPVETAPAKSVPLPASPASPSSEEVDEDQELLRRAIAMVRTPDGGSRPLIGLTDGLKTPPVLPKAGRVVEIRHDPSYEAAYAAKDTLTGLVILRHQDSARLRVMCERLGWQVVEGGASAPQG